MAIDFNPGGTNGPTRSNQTAAPVNKQDSALGQLPNDVSASKQDVPAGSQVKLSNQAQKLQAIEERLRELPEVDSARVAQIKEAIADGSYKVDSGQIADKLIALES